MSPRESSKTDPAQRLAITTAYEALEMAGFVPNTTPSTQRNRVGIFYGMTSDDWREVNSGQNLDIYFIPDGNRAFTPVHINYHLSSVDLALVLTQYVPQALLLYMSPVTHYGEVIAILSLLAVQIS